jgi:exodeoxyribonuclease V alpha subunit
MTDIVLDPSQKRAVAMMVREPVCIVTGGPGTGKSTCTRAALDELDAQGRSYLLAAPTGKAARRMEEVTGRESRTVHRLLAFSGGEFLFNAHNPLETDVVLIDESSMLDTKLASSLVEAISANRTRLVLIGDANQLPSVGAGRVFAELIESAHFPVARLTTLHRAAAESWVCSQAPVVLAGKMPNLDSRPDFQHVECETPAQALDAAVSAAVSFRAQVLVPVHGRSSTDLGARALNVRLQDAFNREGTPAWTCADDDEGGDTRARRRSGEAFRIGDSVIHTRNDYSLGVMNGEVGRIVACDAQTLVVDFGDPGAPRAVAYSREQARSLRLSYALTVHKSQGSEWPWVVVVCHSTHAHMLTRPLLYTAITRAKKGVVLVGDRKGLEYAVRQTRDADRMTALRPRLDAELSRAAKGAA